MDAGPIGQTAKLPVMRTFRAAYARVFVRPHDFIALAAIPFAVGIAGEALILFDPAGMIAGFAENAGVPAASGLRLFIRFLTTFLPWAVFFAAWSRFVFMGKRDTHRPLEFYFGAGEESIFRNDNFTVLLFSGGFIVLAFISLVLLDSPPNSRSVGIPANIITLTLFVFLNVRFILSYPAHAAGHKTTLGTAWKQSSGIALRLLCLLFLVTLPFNLLLFVAEVLHSLVESWGVADAASQDYKALVHLLFVIPRGLALFLGTGVLVAALCLSYRHVISGRDPEKAKATTASDWLNHFVLPLILGTVLGVAGFWIAEALNFTAKELVLLVAVAFLSPLAWKIYRLEYQ